MHTPYGVPALWLTSGLTPVYIHGTRNGQQQVVKEGQLGWVLQAVISRATFWRIPRNSKSHFTMMSFHIINNQYAKKRGIAENLLLAVRTAMQQEQVDMVAGDVNGAAWRRRSGDDQRLDSTIEEAFANRTYSIPQGPFSIVETRWGSRKMV